MPALHLFRRRVASGLLAATAAISGCASIGEPVVLPDVQEADTAPQTLTPEFIPVVRYGRYTLVELAATAAQRDSGMDLRNTRLTDAGFVVGK